ncbi:MAG TPA: hypothetical protein VF189_01310 [Patescibacteria group bacterium]
MKKIEEKLKMLSSIKASNNLKKRIHVMTNDLPSLHRGFYFPLFAFQSAVIATVIIVLVGLGSGFVVAAEGSNPGNLFYPVKKIIQKVPVPFIQEIPTTIPTVMPTIALPSATPSPEEKHENKNMNNPYINNQDPKQNDNENKNQTVEGVSTATGGQENKDSHQKGPVEKFIQFLFHGSQSKGHSFGKFQDK